MCFFFRSRKKALQDIPRFKKQKFVSFLPDNYLTYFTEILTASNCSTFKRCIQ